MAKHGQHKMPSGKMMPGKKHKMSQAEMDRMMRTRRKKR